MTCFRNRAISAAAGTGKTFRLAHRYIGLMAAGVAPDRICALTFSRKAAGEIFDKIVEHLCGAATDAGRRAKTAETIAKEGLGPTDDNPAVYVGLLRKLLDHEHRLRIGTLDSFILGVVRTFPMELGVPPETQPVDSDGGEAKAMRQAILTRLFDPTQRPGAKGSHGGGDAFLDSFRQACFGQESKSLVLVLDKFISEYYGFFRQHNQETWHWGDLARIWQPAERWWEDPALRSAEMPADLIDRLTAAFGSGTRPGALAGTCTRIAMTALGHAADKPWPTLSKTILADLLQAAPHDQPATISYYQKSYSIPADLWPLFRRALANLVGVEVSRALEQTRGLHAVLSHYDKLYADSLSTGGRYTFEDLSRLLGVGGLSSVRMPAAPNRLYIDYRLDGKLDHWLLDEFQDTSDTQWAALANLVDEVVQDENRSFFYVGDIKQSVYGWRGGNHRLFGKVWDAYQGLGSRTIVSEPMSECHRSLPAVIAAVNAVFDGLPGWTPELGAEKGPRADAVAAFAAAWQRHESARLGEGDGFAALLEYPQKKAGRSVEARDEEDADGSDDPSEFEAVAQILEQVKQSLHGRTVAVLVRSNEAGRACVDVLRRQLPDVPVIHEGRGGIVDNPVVTLLLALVRYAAHPGDGVALRHLQMSPLSEQPEMKQAHGLPGVLLTTIHECGFAGALRQWGERLGNLDAFGRQRLRELLAAAEQFDATGVRDPDAFADHVEAYQVKASAAAGTVRVMTIHQAKGLGFDLVIVPFASNAKSFEKPGDPELLAGDGWVLDPLHDPAKEPVGGAPLRALDSARADANFAQLCVLYVALTRAQRALYMVIPEKGKSSKVVRESDLLRERLATGDDTTPGPGNLTQLFATGDCSWFTRPGRRTPPAPIIPVAPVHVTYAADVVRREPSKEHAEGRAFPAQWLFGRESGDVRAFGSAIHRLFQKIEWIEDAEVERIISEWRSESAESASFLADVEQQFRCCLSNPDVRRQLSRPAGVVRAEVWREAPFNLVLDAEGQKQLLSGRFDRLVVERDAAGKPLRATVFDYKSNRVETEEEMRDAAAGYAGQMADYALSAARLLGVSRSQVQTMLIFTRTARLWARPDEG